MTTPHNPSGKQRNRRPPRPGNRKRRDQRAPRAPRAPEPSAPGRIVVGEIRKPWGRYGELSATLDSGLDTPIRPGWTIYINGEPHLVEEMGSAGASGIVLALEGIRGTHTAGGYRGAPIEIDAEALPPPPDGQYYGHQIMGLRVESVSGEPLGAVTEIIETGANDVYAVTPAEAGQPDIMVPVLKEVIKEVDLEVGVIKVDLPDGLI